MQLSGQPRRPDGAAHGSFDRVCLALLPPSAVRQRSASVYIRGETPGPPSPPVRNNPWEFV